jgi:hypothetical protein
MTTDSLYLTRSIFDKDFTIGALYLNSRHLQGLRFLCDILEPDESQRIPKGIYHLRKCFSKKNNCDVLVLLNVPGRTAIEIHIGNYRKDTMGCLIPGLAGVSGIWFSTEYFKLIMSLFDRSLFDIIEII